MKETERILKALANRRRLAILKFLHEKEKASVGDIAHAIKLSFKATSKHLGILSSVDLLHREQISLSMIYSLQKPTPSILKVVLTHL